MIRGITHTEDGQQIQRLAVSTKVAIGLPPNPAEGKKAHPSKLDHFIFLRKSPAQQNAWELDDKLMKAYGTKCKEFEIVLLDDEIENVFPTKLAWFTQSECKCFGDGESATRRTAEHPEGQPWSPCGKACPDLENGSCKPAADLRFMLAAFPQLGAVARIHTSSYRSIMQISSSLQQIQTITGGRLAGIRAKLVVRPEKTSYMGADQKRHSTTVFALNLEIQAAGIKELVTHMTDHARLFEHTRKLLGTGRIEVIEDDSARAGEITPEFYPEVSPPKFPTAEEAGQADPEIIPPIKQANMDVMCQECRQVNGHKPDCFHATQSVTGKSDQCQDCKAFGGHLPSCKHHAAWKASLGQPATAKPSGQTAIAPAEAAQPQTTAAATETAKPADQAPAGLETMTLVVMGVAPKEKAAMKGRNPTGEKQQYRILTVVSKGDLQWALYAWDPKHFEFLDPIPSGTKCEFQTKKTKSGYYQLEHILDTGGLKFKDDKPMVAVEGEVLVDEGEDWSLLDEQPK
jgi:hypothetical protein